MITLLLIFFIKYLESCQFEYSLKVLEDEYKETYKEKNNNFSINSETIREILDKNDDLKFRYELNPELNNELMNNSTEIQRPPTPFNFSDEEESKEDPEEEEDPEENSKENSEETSKRDSKGDFKGDEEWEFVENFELN